MNRLSVGSETVTSGSAAFALQVGANNSLREKYKLQRMSLHQEMKRTLFLHGDHIYDHAKQKKDSHIIQSHRVLCLTSKKEARLGPRLRSAIFKSAALQDSKLPDERSLFI